MNKQWKIIDKYPNYKISNYGEIINIKTNKLKKQRLRKDGYFDIKLHNKSETKMFLVHRLVAQAFILNTNNYKEINHFDGNKQNNRVDNLEWCSRSDNMKHAFKTNLCKSQMKHLKDLHKNLCKKVIQYNMNNQFIKEWDSIVEIEKELGYAHANISKCCLKKPHYNSAYNYKWEFKGE